MKKLWPLIILVFCLSKVNAQSDFRLGLTFSPNISWFDPDTRGISSDGNRIGFRYGVVADFNFSENYAFSSGVFLTHTGGKLNYPAAPSESNGTVGNLQSEIRLQYLEIPLTLKLRTNEIGYMTYYGQIGVSTMINVRSRADLVFDDLNGSEVFSVEDENISDEINLFNMNLVVGGGVEYNISGNTAILVGLSYHNGFTNVLDFETPKVDRSGNLVAGETEKAKANNSFVSLNLGVLF